MKNKDLFTEMFSDVKNTDGDVMFAGQYTSLDLALFYPGGISQ